MPVPPNGRRSSSSRIYTGVTPQPWNFFGQLISSGERGGILTILTFRPEFKIPWPAASHQTVPRLESA